MKAHWSVGAATLGGIGRLKPAPGTWGSAASLLLFWWIWPTSIVHQATLTIALAAAAIAICGRAEQEAQAHDPGWIVLDEAAGMAVSLIGLPRAFLPWLLAFGAFRLFDISKPFPAGVSQKLPGGWGVVTDDLIAGLYAAGLIHVLVHFFPI